MRVDELHYQLCRLGWVWEYNRGSHRFYRHKETGQRFHFAVHGRKLEPHQVRVIIGSLEKLHTPAEVAALREE